MSSGVVFVLRPALRYSHTRDAYVLRIVGNAAGPVLRVNRRVGELPFHGVDRRHRLAR